MKIDRCLVSRVVAGDTNAEEDFYNAMRPQLLRASKGFLGFYDGDTEDMVQETFIVALAKLKDYTFEAPIVVWLRQICLRQCYGRMRKRKRQFASAQEDLELFMQDLALQRSQREVDELDQLDRLEQLQQVKQALSPETRQIIDLKYVRGLSYAKIGQKLNIPQGTVMSRLARARDQIRSLVELRADEEQCA